MPRENSFSDSDGRSLTPDLEEELADLPPVSPISPTYQHQQQQQQQQQQQHPSHLGHAHDNKSHKSHISHKSLKSALSHFSHRHANSSGGAAGASHVKPSIEILETGVGQSSDGGYRVQVKSPSSTRSPKPRRSGIQDDNHSSHPPPLPFGGMTPINKFRSTVRKVIAMRRTSMMMMSRRWIGAEPGIDPRRASASLNYGHIKQQCLIEVVDYSSVRSSFGKMTNSEFIKLMSDRRASEREPWVKVRWINVGGISWDVISALAIKYDMHPLALEDVLHQRVHTRSKADYYSKHLFLRILSHTLASEDEPHNFTHLPRSASPEPVEVRGNHVPEDDDDDDDSDAKAHIYGVGDEKTTFSNASGSKFSAHNGGATKGGTMRNAIRRKFGGPVPDVERQPMSAIAMATAIAAASATAPASGHGARAPSPQAMRFSLFTEAEKKDRKNARNIKIIKELKKGERVNVKIAPMCIFLFRDGTVISIHPDSRMNFTAPIAERLRHTDTGLRTTADPSLLVQSLIDLVVDQALEVVEEYQSKILSLEHNVLVKPSMASVRRLHILQGDLILHKRTLEPIKTVIYGLRRYDVDRVAALQEKFDPNVKTEGFMSHKARIYLADVHDHMEYILTSLDMFAGISENLINYTFNMSSYDMNEVMRQLTLATIIFLPLTLLTGYFGMNFDNMWTVHHGHSDIIFWIIGLPVMGIVVPIFLWSDIRRMYNYMKKKFLQKSIKKEVKEDYRLRKLKQG